MSKQLKIAILLLIVGTWQQILPVTTTDAASGQYQAHQLRAMFLFNLANFVSWPENAFKDPKMPIQIVVMGQEKFAKFLEKVVEGETAQGRPIVVERRQEFENLDNSHIIFMDSGLEKQWPSLFKAVEGRQILTVSDADSFIHHGGMINLVNRKNRIVIEIHAKRARENGLHISSKLLKLARIIR